MVRTCVSRPSRNGYVAFKRPYGLQVLTHVVADFDDLAGDPPIAEGEARQRRTRQSWTRFVRRRRRLTEPDQPPKRFDISGAGQPTLSEPSSALPPSQAGEVSTPPVEQIRTRLFLNSGQSPERSVNLEPDRLNFFIPSGGGRRWKKAVGRPKS